MIRDFKKQATQMPFKAEELSVVTDNVTADGVSFWLYVNRMSLEDRLDAIMGPENWTFHTTNVIPRQNGTQYMDGQLLLRDNPGSDWVGREGVGTPQVFLQTAMDKSQETNCFKRACLAWGLGRELQDICPGVPLFSSLIGRKQDRDGNWWLDDSLAVKGVAYENGKIVSLGVISLKNRRYVYVYDGRSEEKKKADALAKATMTDLQRVKESSEKKPVRVEMNAPEPEPKKKPEQAVPPAPSPAADAVPEKAKPKPESTPESKQPAAPVTPLKDVTADCGAYGVKGVLITRLKSDQLAWVFYHTQSQQVKAAIADRAKNEETVRKELESRGIRF